jgi:hypothetical protein
MSSYKGRLSPIVKGVHLFILINFSLQILYGGYMVFVGIAPEGHMGPLWGAAVDMPFEALVARRLYALETWVAIVGMSLYVGLTEILPRKLNGRKER